MTNKLTTNLINKKRKLLAHFCILTVTACGSQQTKEGGTGGTLADLDLSSAQAPIITQTNTSPDSSFDQAPKNTDAEGIKQAYYDYIKNAAKGDKLRVNAATRIAELELEEVTDNERAYEKKVRGTITLLEDTLADLPDTSGGDQAYYLLAKAYDQVGQLSLIHI